MEQRLWFVRYSVLLENIRIDGGHAIIDGLNARSALFNFMLDESQKLKISMKDIKILALNAV
jgi:hypothetical protein